MNITEIETYRKAPSPASFLAIDDAKEKEIDRQIQKLKNIKTVMQEKKEKIVLCETLYADSLPASDTLYSPLSL